MKFFVAFTFSFCCLFTFAQKKAVTELGEEVILYSDGTWIYENTQMVDAADIPTNPKKFSKPKESSFQVKSTVIPVGFWLNPKKWAFRKTEEGGAAEYQLDYKEGALYGMIITEEIEISLTALRKIAIQNARAVAPDLEVIDEEYRTVNGKKVLFMQMIGTTDDIKFTYYGYYYSGPKGTVQLVTYTTQNFLDTYREPCEYLLNGFVVED